VKIIRKPIRFIYKRVKNPFKKLKLWLKYRAGWLGVPVIVPYRGFGREGYYYISGRVSEDKGLAAPLESQSIWQNMKAMIKRFISDEIPDVRVKIKFYDQEKIVKTNEEGFFEAEFDAVSGINLNQQWHIASLTLLDNIREKQTTVVATGEIQTCTPGTAFCTISDIDDTILISHSTNFIKKMRLLLMKNAITRLPFEGVSAFYRALYEGKNSGSINPIIFISSSEWNLYDLLIDFCNFRNIPKGTFMLDDLRKSLFQKKRKKSRSHMHKIDKIRMILNTIHDKPFVLIGDSGQKDAEIYSQISFEFPGRVLCIYIRDVRKSRKSTVAGIANNLKTKGIEMILIKNTAEAAIHALEKGLISQSHIPDIFKEIDMDELAPSEFEGLFSHPKA
jgi:phosphatidate phosphatase APP1